MIGSIARFVRNTSGAAAAEMALILPLLALLLFGGVEVGSFFWTEHQVIKSVRTGARYAARQEFSNFSCGATALSDNTIDASVRDLVKTGTLDGTGNNIVRDWPTDDDGIDITITCDAGSDYSNKGIYSDQSGTGTPAVPSAMYVEVNVTIPYPSLFEDLGYLNGRNISAAAQSPVTGF